MKFNISYPANGTNKKFEVSDMAKLNSLFNLRISSEIAGETLDAQFDGYIFKIMGGNDKQGFTMKQGVLTNTRVRLLLAKGHSCYRPRRKGERKRKSVRGCEVGPDIAVLHLTILKKGEKEIPGLTDVTLNNRLGPKRASKIRKLFSLTQDDDPRDFAVVRKVERNGKVNWKRPKIQRLVTSRRRTRKQKWLKIKKDRIHRKVANLKHYKALKAKKAREEA